MKGRTRVPLLVCVTALALLLGALVLAGQPAAQTAQPTPLRFTFLFAPTGSFANFIVSQDRGFFGEEGLNVSFIVPGSPADALKLVAGGEARVRDRALGELLSVARKIFNNHLAGTQTMLRELARESRRR